MCTLLYLYILIDKDVTNGMRKREYKTTAGVAVCYMVLLRNKKSVCVCVVCLLLGERKRYKLLKIHKMSAVLETINV